MCIKLLQTYTCKVIKELTAQEDAEYEAAKKIVEDYETKQDR